MNILRGTRRAFYRALGYYPTRLGNEPFRVDPEHIWFWRKARRREWEPATLAMYDRHVGPASAVLDLGAWIGPTVLYAGRRCGTVWAVEPDPVAYRYLTENLRLNDLTNVRSFQTALGATTGARRFGSAGGQLGNSTSSLLTAGDGDIEVPVTSWAQWQRDAGPIPDFDFIKMDIEGAEFELLPAMTEYLHRRRPTLLLSIHATLLPLAQRGAAMTGLNDLLRGYRRCVDMEGNEVDARFVTEHSLRYPTAFLYSS